MRYIWLLVGLVLLIAGVKMALGVETVFNDEVSKQRHPDGGLTPLGLLIPGTICVAIGGGLFLWKSKFGSNSFYDTDNNYPDRDTRGPDDMDGGGDG